MAARTAQTYNDAGFDMIYLDALDGGDTVAGREWAWHYEAKFTWEIWKRLKRPAIMEMSTFHHHLWYVRSRGGAWDHPTRSHKKFIDIHVAANEAYQRMFLPGHLGWWAFKTWSGASGDPTYPDDIEYLCAKALGHDTGFSIMGVDPTSIRKAGVLPRLSAIVRRYEALRHAGYFNEAVKEKLRVPGDEYRLVQAPDGEWCFVPAQYERHKVQGLDGWSNVWKVSNRFAEQPLKLRIQGLLSAGPYDAPGNPTLASFGAPDEFERPRTQNGITLMLQPSRAHVKAGGISGCLTASSALPTATRTWGCATRTFGPPLDLSAHQGLGVWVHGDGKGEVLNLQLTSPLHLSHAIADHYIDVNFTGWRYFELIEPEGARHADYAWPYGGIYSIYRESVRPSSIETLSLYVNNVPANGSVTTYLSPVRAVPVVKAKLRNPAVSVNGKTLTFPVEIERAGIGVPLAYGVQAVRTVRRVDPRGDARGRSADPQSRRERSALHVRANRGREPQGVCVDHHRGRAAARGEPTGKGGVALPEPGGRGAGDVARLRRGASGLGGDQPCPSGAGASGDGGHRGCPRSARSLYRARMPSPWRASRRWMRSRKRLTTATCSMVSGSLKGSPLRRA